MAQYKTLRAISRRMNWRSPATAFRRHKFDSFPLWPDFTRRGLVWRTNDDLIEMWEAEKVRLAQGLRLKKPYKHKNPHRRYFWRIRRELVKEKETHIETGDAALSRGKKSAPCERPLEGIRAGKSLSGDCTCGTRIPCTAHDGVGQGRDR